ncbi:hypothetical protein HK098_004975 [Nowakowskiella sp. JEL0407]|nr:hypothetical protein HK098_004975 [Nowakowskiella sp. JEL0407]
MIVSLIFRYKAANDLTRGKKFSKLTKQIISAVRSNNKITNPALNPELSSILSQCKLHQMPKSVIETALKKAALGTGEPDQTLCYGSLVTPQNIALLIECISDSPNRTRQEVRLALKDLGYAVTDVGYFFEKRKKGRIVLAVDGNDDAAVVEERVMTDVLDYNVEDVSVYRADEYSDSSKTMAEVICLFEDLMKLKETLEKLQYGIEEMETFYDSVVDTRVELAAEYQAEFEKIISTLEDLDDVSRVYSNVKQSS